MPTTRFPARLYVLLARDAPRAVILRRGPSKLVRVILWHTDSDAFEHGQWLRGRIYAERCDLSPDGSLLLAFVAQQHKTGDGYRGTWSAISKPPYLTALALWSLGHTWCGGGVFLTNRTVYLDACGSNDAHPAHRPPKHLRVISNPTTLNAHKREQLARARAHGWQAVHVPEGRPAPLWQRADEPFVWQLPHPANDRFRVLRRYYGYIPDHYPGPAINEYAVRDEHTGRETSLYNATWAGWDQRGRLAYARDGQIFAHAVEQLGRFMRPVTDFNDQTFEAIAAPGWARRW